MYVKVLVTQSCPTLCNPMDCSLPGTSIHGIFQARVLEGIATSFFRGPSRSRDRTQVSCIADSLLSEPMGWPTVYNCLQFFRRYSFMQPPPQSRYLIVGFSGGPVVRNLPANARDMGSIPGPERYHMTQGN